jgi:hypothetical protein
MSESTKTFSPERAQELADELANVVNNSRALAVEKVYAIASVLRALGETLYDRTDVNYDAVLADYSLSPTWPAALILISHLPHEIRELLIRERDNPEANVQLWKEHEEKIKHGSSA